MTTAEIIFLLIIMITMGGAATSILAGSIIYAILGLVTAMFGMAGLYIYLDNAFLAMMQILIYVGAVTVLIAFAIMLAGPLHRRPKEWTTLGKFVTALVVAVVTFFVFSRFIRETFSGYGAPSFSFGAKDVGRVFLTDLLLPFELISLLVVVAILGAIMLALISKGRS